MSVVLVEMGYSYDIHDKNRVFTIEKGVDCEP